MKKLIAFTGIQGQNSIPFCVLATEKPNFLFTGQSKMSPGAVLNADLLKVGQSMAIIYTCNHNLDGTTFKTMGE